MKVNPKKRNLGKTLSVSVDQLEVEEFLNVEKPKDIDGLADAIRVHGLRHPLQVRRKRGSDKLHIIDGRRRWLASCKVGLKEVAVVDNGYLTDVDAVTISHVENYMRRKGNKKECINDCRLLKASGLNNNEISERLFLSKSAVSDYLSISRAKPKVRKAVEEGTVTVKEGVRVSKLDLKMQEEEIEKEIERRVKIAVDKTREACLPRVNEDPSAIPALTQNVGILMPGEKLNRDYRLVSDYKERCQKMENEVQSRLRKTPSNAKLQGMNLVIGVLRGKLTVDQALTNWDGI